MSELTIVRQTIRVFLLFNPRFPFDNQFSPFVNVFALLLREGLEGYQLIVTLVHCSVEPLLDYAR